MQLQIVDNAEHHTHLALVGRLDTPGVDQVEPRFYSALKDRLHGIVDLSEVSFLSSMGIRMFISAAKMLARRGGRLVLLAPRQLVDQALQHSSIDEIIPIAPDLPSAMKLIAT